MMPRIWLSLFLGLATLFGFPILDATASRQEASLRDTVYVSPSWGYLVHWYGDEWTVSDESSVDKTDQLWLKNGAGTVVGFEGGPGYGGDATICLEARIAAVKTIPGATDVVIVTDEEDAVQALWDARWSWATLLARLPVDDQPVDHVIHLDCRTLAPGRAVLTRYLASPVAGFQEDDPRLDVLDVAFPRGAWDLDPETGALAPAPGVSAWDSRFPPWRCGSYPRSPVLLLSTGRAELGMMTPVDGAGMVRVVTIENSGPRPLMIDPRRFTIDQGVQPTRAQWLDSSDGEPRSLDPGGWATLTIEFPVEGTIVYSDPVLAGGEADVDFIGAFGCGGGSRPRLRLAR